MSAFYDPSKKTIHFLVLPGLHGWSIIVHSYNAEADAYLILVMPQNKGKVVIFLGNLENLSTATNCSFDFEKMRC